jgi:phosphoenolpyruvate-protein phosphotransferase
VTLALLAPMKGWVSPLGEVPDPAFASGLVGDGVGLEPLGATLHAPCAGTVTSVHRARHAVTIQADMGAEILCHVGIETVALDGAGFVSHVAAGDRVEAGTPLLDIDLDRIAAAAPSLATPVLLLDDPAFRIERRLANRAVERGDWLMDVVAIDPGAGRFPARGEEAVLERTLRIPAGHGVHARPAAAIAGSARRFAAEVEFVTAGNRAPATSAVALMTLGLAAGDSVVVRARGVDAAAALAEISALIEREQNAAPERLAPSSPAGSPAGRGVTAVPGLAIGTVRRLDGARREPPARGAGVAAETERFETALAQVRAALNERTSSGPAAQREIARAHRELLDDPRLHTAVSRAIESGASAGMAWRTALAPDIAALRAVADPRIAGRADDLRDLEQQVIAATLGGDAEPIVLPPGTILVAEDLLPSELMASDARSLAGIALAGGGPTSHVAIIAASLDLPMVVALGPAALDWPEEARVVLDAQAGTLVAADPAAEAAAHARLAADRDRRIAAQAAAGEACRMADGERIEVFANLGSVADAEAAMAIGAEGCGLLRTELLFLDRDDPPGEEEQRGLYQAIADRLQGRPLIIRTLDVGGDKPVRYLPLPAEENPALGLRGIRVGLAHPALLDGQLRAILALPPTASARILLPMIASLDELRAVRARAEAIAQALGRREAFSLGVMIETPAAAIAADLLAPAADFFAIGTNDLAQYTLAMDRGNPAMAPQVDAMHPAVLRLIGAVARAAGAQGRPVGVCGGLASDPRAAAILIGLGVSELSAVPAIIPELKAHVRTLSRAGCEALATAALAQPSAAAVRALVEEHAA